MGGFKCVVLILAMVVVGKALRCRVCDNAPNNQQCRQRGRLQTCQANERACQTEVRRGSFGVLITKRCKEAHACDNNFIQNPRAAWSPSQCNSETPSSVCRCCCNFSGCNAGLACQGRRRPTKPRDPATCAPMRTPRHGSKQCAPRSEAGNGRVPVGTVCVFLCDEGYRLHGAGSSACRAKAGHSKTARFRSPTPTCRGVVCSELIELENGEITCTDGRRLGSICHFSCNETDGYRLYPSSLTTATCLRNHTWNSTKPCCSRPCPPYAVMDLVFVLDSSSSIGAKSWKIMKKFVYSIIKSFIISQDQVRVGVFRFNEDVDEESQIKLKDFPDDKAGLLRAFNRIPYNGKGTQTGRALQHLSHEILVAKNGDRTNVPDVAVVITDGKAQDGRLLDYEAEELRRHGVIMYAVGVEPPTGSLNVEQLRSIAGNSQHVLLVESGFSGLNHAFSIALKERICYDRCTGEFLDL